MRWGGKMNKYSFKNMERKVYLYKRTLREIKMLELDIIEGGDRSVDDIGQGSQTVRKITDMTAIKANTLQENAELNRMREDVRAIERAFNRLIIEKQDLIALYYWGAPNRYTWAGIAERCNVSRATAMRWRDAFIKDVIKEVGEY